MNTNVAPIHSAASAADPDDSSVDADNPPEYATANPNACEVKVSCAVPAGHLDAAWLRDRLLEALTRVRCPARSVTVTIVGDARMRLLNRTHRGVDDITDVLAFDQTAPGGPIHADIVVCADEAERRAAQMNHSAERELLLYALHGVMHCAGFDDGTPASFQAMHNEEDRILTDIGVGATFCPRDRSHRGRTENSEGETLR